MKEKLKKLRTSFFFLSLLLHMTVMLVLRFSPSEWFTPPKKEVVEISFTPAAPDAAPVAQLPPEQKTEASVKKKALPIEKNQVVDQDEKPLNDEVPDDTRFLSAHNQVVKKQTVATEHGDFQNSGESERKAGHGKNEQVAETKTDAESLDTSKPKILDLKPEFDVSKAIKANMEAEKLEENALLQANLKRHDEKEQRDQAAIANTGGSGEAATDQNGAAKAQASQTLDYIKDLDAGMQTLLSSKEFVYYTYYNRIRRQLSQYWGNKVKEKIARMYKSGRRIASSDDKITRLLITLDKAGNLMKAQIVGDSGIHDLDEAAVEAFRSAAPFPNPPKGMVDPDGNIKIRWDFILEG